MTDVDPYSTVKQYLGALPSWVADEQERLRLASYAFYEAVYWGVPGTFKLISRGEEDKPIYVPSGKGIVETMHRYCAPKMEVVPDPAFGDPNQQLLATQVWTDFARRERVYSKFNANKRYGLMRGDWCFQLYADPLRPEAARISLLPVDPGSVFPIYNPLNVDEIIGYHLAESILDNEGKARVRRLTYRKVTGTGGPSPITMEDAIYDLEDWGGPGMSDEKAKLVQVITPLTTLPAPIDQLPIYMIPNFETPGTIYGSSEMRGLERLMAAINQSVSDEELSLALEGLGIYWTDAGTPVNEDGEEVDWDLGPGRVVEVPNGKTMHRLNAAGSMEPYQDHIKMLMDMVYEGKPGVARGRVDVQVAESGIALLLELSPILASAEEKELTITDKMSNLLYDLSKWWIAYEGTMFSSLLEATRWVPKYGEKVPPNRSKDLQDLLAISSASPQIVPMSYIRQRLRVIGFTDLPDDATLEAEILAEQEARARVQQDAFGLGVDQAVNAELGAPSNLDNQGTAQQ